MRGSPRRCAHRPLPSMTMPTWVGPFTKRSVGVGTVLSGYQTVSEGEVGVVVPAVAVVGKGHAGPTSLQRAERQLPGGGRDARRLPLAVPTHAGRLRRARLRVGGSGRPRR